MPVRLRITFLFSILVMIILAIVCGSIYYFSYTARLQVIKTRLTNRALTTARLLAQQEAFTHQLVQRIDSLTTLSLKNKIVQAYDYKNNVFYRHSDVPGDSLTIEPGILNEARINQAQFFTIAGKEAVACHYSTPQARMVVVTAAEDIEGKSNLYALRNILLLGFSLGTIIVLVTGYLFSARLLQPIKKITDDVEDISAQNLSRRIETGKPKDEWYHLADTLNNLLDRLQESFELQRRFISNASHELSTPLTSISSQLEVSLQREREAGKYREVMQSIYQDVQHMSKLTQTLLEFAKASGNPGGLELSPVRVDEIIMDLPAEMARANEKYNVVLRFDELPEQEEDLLVFGNGTLLLSAVKNIVGNACKYSADHRAVVHLQVNEENIVISVTDKGKGIPEKDLKTIFQPFYRVEENVSGEGFGLGLALVDRIIKLHKGTIEVSSELGKGTRFAIILPVASNADKTTTNVQV